MLQDLSETEKVTELVFVTGSEGKDFLMMFMQFLKMCGVKHAYGVATDDEEGDGIAVDLNNSGFCVTDIRSEDF